MPTAIYVKPVLALLEQVNIHGMAHITGGGLSENVPRALPEGLGCLIDRTTWEQPAIFRFLAALQSISNETLYRTWNMGIGYVLIVAQDDAALTIRLLEASGTSPRRIGVVQKGSGVTFSD